MNVVVGSKVDMFNYVMWLDGLWIKPVARYKSDSLVRLGHEILERWKSGFQLESISQMTEVSKVDAILERLRRFGGKSYYPESLRAEIATQFLTDCKGCEITHDHLCKLCGINRERWRQVQVPADHPIWSLLDD